jgi:hypothetical protein
LEGQIHTPPRVGSVTDGRKDDPIQEGKHNQSLLEEEGRQQTYLDLLRESMPSPKITKHPPQISYELEKSKKTVDLLKG